MLIQGCASDFPLDLSSFLKCRELASLPEVFPYPDSG
jgi:hypothetical protein